MKTITIGITLLIGLYIIYALCSSILHLWQKSDEVTRAQNKLEEARQTNQKLKSELSYVQSDSYVEKIAREKLHLVKPDETLVFMPGSEDKIASVTPTPVPQTWQQWIDLFY